MPAINPEISGLMEKPYLIVGQGLAGTFISMRLWEAGVPFRVIDLPSLSQSSRIAAGLANPIVLKRQKWVAHAELYLGETEAFYRAWEDRLGTSFYHPVELEHVLHNSGETNDWISNSEKPYLKDHLGPINKTPLPEIAAPHGRAEVKGIFWCNTQEFIESWKINLRKHDLLIEDQWESGLNVDSRGLIFCNGHLLRESHPNLSAAFSPTKGELMVIKAHKLPEDRILHAGVFALPLGQGLFKIGASYSHQDLTENTSPSGLEFLKSKLEVFYKGGYEIIDHQAGVRPNIKDRKPLMGRISESEWTFNGLGSRGVLMGPYLSKHFADHLIHDSPLKPEWDLKRFI